MVLTLTDRLALGAIEAALQDAREAEDQRPALKVLADSLAEVQERGISSERSARLVLHERDAWLRQLQNAQRSRTTINSRRAAIDDLLAWAQRARRTGDLFQEQAIVDYLADYQQRCCPALSTYRNRFTLLRTFMVWVSRRQGTPNPFQHLQVPSLHEEPTWLTREEFAQLLAGGESPERVKPGTVERDRLVLTALLFTGLRRSELIAVRWADIDLDRERPSLLVRRAKGGRHRRQPLPLQLSKELRCWRELRRASTADHVFCGLTGRRLAASALQRIIARAASRVDLKKRVTTDTMRDTAATWLRQAGAGRRLVAEYLGVVTSPISRYADVESEDMRAAVQSLADYAIDNRPLVVGRHSSSPHTT